MTTESKPTPPKRVVPSALRPLLWVGIPESVLAWKPRLPSRNWCIFWASVATVSYLYYDDRKQCKKILEEYKERVRGLSDGVMHPHEHPRKVLVYTAKYPGDDNYDVSAVYFKRYVKPILVAAAVDYEILSGTRYGNLARELRDRIHERRRNLAGLQPWTTNTAPGTALPTTLSPAEHLQRELDGAVVLVGRPALKEWAWALKEGWGTSIPVKPVDYDEQLSNTLSTDSAFDEEDVAPAASSVTPDVPLDEANDEDGAPLPSSSSQSFMLPTQVGLMSMQKGAGFSPAGIQGAHISTHANASTESAASEPELPPMLPIPAQPPLCFIDFTNMVGWRNIPNRIVRFFNRRADVRRGAEAGLSIVLGSKDDAREFEPGSVGAVRTEPPQGEDLDWGIGEEAYYPKSFDRTIEDIEKSRKTYYEDLKKELKASREIARGEREPTKAEKRLMPKTETELRHQRFEKEKQWRNSEQGYHILKPSSGVIWDENWRGSLRVLRPRSEEERVPRLVREEEPAEEKLTPAEEVSS
ncbi:mitochondrial import inner membrane translocase subunit Tim54 [Malassezia pachydermatis]|uniref:Mitochondrial import inner membrane translocase subunit TIM54 n=1 Tax=Malassezia pachydermatis TaxID=77020 RepID=A0A0M9VPQ4_9BASI|nr:hypothetical protein Malapachy_1167 [Malassezia pachydermatis]KOS14712.1 hypothetical protein Malapachy_1167 [Malassezia pachydermatis]